MRRRNTERVAQTQRNLRHPIPLTPDDPDRLPDWVIADLTSYASKLFKIQWELAPKYQVIRRSYNLFSVTYANADAKHVHVRSVVYASECLRCTCVFFLSQVMVCRHLIAVMKFITQELDPFHIHLRWHKSWLNGFFLNIYHREFQDGFPGIAIDIVQ